MIELFHHNSTPIKDHREQVQQLCSIRSTMRCLFDLVLAGDSQQRGLVQADGRGQDGMACEGFFKLMAEVASG